MNDTHPDIERKRIELLRQMTPSRRAQLGSQLSNQARWRAMRSLDSARPELSELERKLLFVRLHYGRELSERVRTHLAERQT